MTLSITLDTHLVPETTLSTTLGTRFFVLGPHLVPHNARFFSLEPLSSTLIFPSSCCFSVTAYSTSSRSNIIFEINSLFKVTVRATSALKANSSVHSLPCTSYDWTVFRRRMVFLGSVYTGLPLVTPMSVWNFTHVLESGTVIARMAPLLAHHLTAVVVRATFTSHSMS